MKRHFAPFGRMPEYLATLTEEQRQRTAVKAGRNIGDNDTAQTWTNRPAMVKTIRLQERSAPCSEWHPVIPLTYAD